MDSERFISGNYQQEDSSVELSLRPHALRDYVGQKAIKDSLDIYIQELMNN